MVSLISRAISRVGWFFHKLAAKRFLPIVAVGLMLLADNGSPALSNPNLSSQDSVNRLDELVQKGNPERPKTTAEWTEQADETRGRPVERAKRIGEQSVDAVKEFGSMYGDVARRNSAELRNNSKAR